MLNDIDRAHIARYEALLSFSKELIRLGEVGEVARLLGEQLKYVCNAFCWRYLGKDAGAPQDTRIAPAPLFCLEGGGEALRCEAVGMAGISGFERELWASGRARNFDSTQLDERIGTLPPLFRNPEIAQLHVHPIWPGQELEALFLVASRGVPLDALDLKFIASIATFLHRKVSAMRAEQRVNRELREALDHLRSTQDELIQAEKMAALGSLVAGISHELNTPVANVVLMSSSLIDHIKSLDALLKGPGIKRSDLLRWQGGAMEMMQVLDHAIERASGLLTSFKQVAVDQTSERRRRFDLRDCVEEVLDTLRPSLKRTPWQLRNEVPRGIECDTFPGPLGQILANLVQNAAVHAFEGRSEGSVSITASLHRDQLVIAVTDDGIGISGPTLAHIFEPFFTTKLGKGGSGLGLSISYRIATTILAGDLRALSTPGAGTRFLLTMPPHTPRKL